MSRHNIATIDKSVKFSVVEHTMRGVTTPLWHPSSHSLPVSLYDYISRSSLSF